MTENEFQVFSVVRSKPNISLLKVRSFFPQVDPGQIDKVLDAIEYRGLVFKSDTEEGWEKYKANEWKDIAEEEREANASRFMCLKFKEFRKRSFSAPDLIEAFHGELSVQQCDNVIQQLILKRIVQGPPHKGDGKEYIKIEVTDRTCEPPTFSREDLFVQLNIDQSTNNIQQITDSIVHGSVSQSSDSSHNRSIREGTTNKKNILKTASVIIGIMASIATVILFFNWLMANCSV